MVHTAQPLLKIEGAKIIILFARLVYVRNTSSKDDSNLNTCKRVGVYKAYSGMSLMYNANYGFWYESSTHILYSFIV